MTTLEPSDYAATLEHLKRQVREARYTAQRRVNTELLRLYQSIGQTLLQRTESEAWGSRIITQLAKDLRAEFPEMKGFSPSNLKYMRLFARAWPDRDAIGQQAAGQLPWGHLMLLLDKLDTPGLRDWYAAAAVRHGWTRDVLRHQITTDFHEREAAASSNFAQALKRTDSELAQQITKDPYILDFLALDGDAQERELEQGLVDRIIDTLRELGAGFAFVGRQVHFDVGGDDFYLDLLFFHTEQLRYVVVELKTGKFKPEHSGQLGFYVALVDERLRRLQHAHTVGILLCSDKNDSVVRYALAGSQAPIAVSSYDLLPAAEKAALPSEDELTRALAGSGDE
ncbi:YhcG family protein [Cryobacterium sp. M15]|uniref:PDDEXK nuclease domain-containing protein n=1 Tax=Cryobacterium sp. M15 TaxID=2048291 RepID=UPI000CE471B4|nr:PDDEXK nuclease domain-containing protein [Cryobacterium sp. M15]